MLEVRLLGKFEVKHNNKLISISSRPAQSLFAYLILNAGTPHRREKLAGMLWPDSLEETARDNLRHALWRIRKALPTKPTVEYLLTDDLSIAFNASADYWLDAALLENVDDDCSADESIKILSEYQGELLPGFYEEWVVLQREHLYSIFEHHMARLMSLLENENRWLDILDWAERWIKLGQRPEPAYRALMSAHAAKGDMSKVAATYERCLKSFKEFGIAPSEQTRALYESLKSGKETPRVSTTPTKFSTKETASNIPIPLTSFIGRGKELKRIEELVLTSRLLTLTGSGGVGKTRLAIQAANDLLKKFHDGVVWVSLVGLTDENLIPQEIAQSLNVGEMSQESVIETLKSYLKARDILIVLDNCEHLIRGCAMHAEQLLATCPKLKILATSIEALGLFNETTWQVPSLSLPATQQSLSLEELREFSSIELFVERATAANMNFRLTEETSNAVAQICRRLDGIPLAIELAAARTKVLSVSEIATRLDDRFSLLTAGSRTSIPRHQTLRATIDWSYELLTDHERILFRRLAVFAGGFSLDAAETVCSGGELRRNDILDVLGRLVDKSLVIVEQEATTAETHYRLLETIRQYALEKLIESGEASAVRGGHLEYYLALAEKAEVLLFSGEQARWVHLLDKELDNMRAAVEWAMSIGQADKTLRIAGSLVYYWFAHRLAASEWQDWVQTALTRPEGLPRTLYRAKALNSIGFMYFGDIVPTDLRPELEEALSIARELGDLWNIATALRNLGLMENVNGNYLEARRFLEESLAIWPELGAPGKFGRAWTLIFLGDVALNREEEEQARRFYGEVASILRGTGDINFLAYAVRRLGQLLWRAGEYEEAIALCKESLNYNQEVGSPRGVISCLAGFAAIAIAQNKYPRATQLMAAVETQMISLGIRPMYMDQQEYERNLARLRAELDEKSLARFWEKGKNLSLDETIDLALKEA